MKGWGRWEGAGGGGGKNNGAGGGKAVSEGWKLNETK